MGKHTSSIPKDSPSGCILQNWNCFVYHFLTPKQLIFLCNIALVQYQVRAGERSITGSLNYNTILELDLICPRQKNWDEIPTIQFMALKQNKCLQKGCGFSPTEVIPVLDPLPEDLLDLLPNPPPTAPSLSPSFIYPNMGHRTEGPLHTSPAP